MKSISFFLLLGLSLLNFLTTEAQNKEIFNHVNYTLTGQVKDKDNLRPLVFASVAIKGTNDKCLTDDSGYFKIKTSHPLPLTLLISSVGFEKRELFITNDSSAYVLMKLANDKLEDVLVTSRRRIEQVQNVPIPIAVLSRNQIENSASFNVNRVKELVPSVQLYSSNPRNTGINIRGLGSTFGLTNDGIDPGVGFYVDGVYYSRPSATTIDFIDINQIEVLMGPQGTLFGKNTTAGTFNVTTRRPTFKTTFNFESSYGNYNYTQSKLSFSGPVVENKLAARISFIGTNREGVLYNVRTNKDENTLNNLGGRFQLLYKPNEKTTFNLSADKTIQKPSGYAQVYAGTVLTKRSEFRQFENIIHDLNYDLPSRNPFDRIIDQNTVSKSNQEMGGISFNLDRNIGNGKLTSTSAWRYWNWDPSSDRDFTGLDALRKSQAPSNHQQFSQEVRYAGDLGKKVTGVFGIFVFNQHLKSDSVHTEEIGADQWRFSETSTNTIWQTPGLLDGYGIKTKQDFKNFSGAIFTQLDIKIGKNWSILPGLRLNYDEKSVYFKRTTYGGLETSDSMLLAIKKAIYSNQEFTTSIKDFNKSGDFTINYTISKKYRIFVRYALSFKPVGINMGGLPTQNGIPMLELASVKPETVNHYEFGMKSEPISGSILNFTSFITEIGNYQTLVQTPDLSVNRGYLSNAEKVRVMGAELNCNYKIKSFLSLNASACYTDGKYLRFNNAPVPLEETGSSTYKDISGGKLPGISKWSASLGVEYSLDGNFLGQDGNYFFAADNFYRSNFSSSPSPSQFLNIEGYSLLNARIGFKAIRAATIFLWSRNLLNQKYFEQLLPASGNAGQYGAVLGDPRTYGLTIKYNL